MNGRPLTLSWENDNVDAILETWWSGTRGGDAIAQTLFGDNNPSGKLPITFPRNVGQVPLYYNHKNTGRPSDSNSPKFQSNYLDIPNSPLFPFGFGLSYTSFSYSDLSIDKKEMKASEKIAASVTVTNNGNYDGEEVVQLYIRDIVGSITRPLKELKGFQKVFLKKGESKKITFTIGIDDLKFYNYDLKWVAEPGEFEVMIGTNSDQVNKGSFKLLK
jgi:beta-glucosidase